MSRLDVLDSTAVGEMKMPAYLMHVSPSMFTHGQVGSKNPRAGCAGTGSPAVA
jgi:hypothetical protein